MTRFDDLNMSGLPRQQSSRFKVAEIEYVVFFTQITSKNPLDAAVDLPKGFYMPQYINHYDVTFDSVQNMNQKTHFERVDLPEGAGTRVIKCVERIIFDHYNEYRVGLYSFAPADLKLTSVYCRLISKKKHKGSTIEVGLEPEGKANVLRTPRFY